MNYNNRKIRNRIKENKFLNEYNDEELEFVQTTTGKALYKHNLPEQERIQEEDDIPRGQKSPNDRIKCKICGKAFTRSSRTHHNRTVYHTLKKLEHDKLKKILID